MLTDRKWVLAGMKSDSWASVRLRQDATQTQMNLRGIVENSVKKEAFNLVVSDKISYTREVGSYSNVWLNEMLIK